MRFWWGEAPARPKNFDEAAGLLKPSAWLHLYAGRAAVYRDQGEACCPGKKCEHPWPSQVLAARQTHGSARASA